MYLVFFMCDFRFLFVCDICFFLLWVGVSYCYNVHEDLIFCVCFLVYRLFFWFYDYYLYYVG